MAHIRLDDQVMVICGKDKGKIARVIRILQDRNRVVLEKVNVVKKHSKPSQKNPQGGILEKELSVHVSNVMLLDPKSGKPTRIGIRMQDGKKIRYSKKSQEPIEVKK